MRSATVIHKGLGLSIHFQENRNLNLKSVPISIQKLNVKLFSTIIKREDLSVTPDMTSQFLRE